MLAGLAHGLIRVRLGVSPEVSALASLLLSVVFALVFVAF
jgi:hypothetical protein